MDQEEKRTRSVSHQKNKIFGTFFCVVLVLSIYVGFVFSLNELFGGDFIEMVSLSSQAHSKDDYRFAMGDTMLVSARVRSGNVYRLNIYDDSDRLVSENVGTVDRSDVRVSVAIWPSVFNAGHVYNLSLIVGLVNRPLVGMSAVDSFTGPFEVVKSSTRLNLTTNYDEAAHNLRAATFLTTSDDVPIENGIVSFYVQPNIDFVKPDRGWVLMGSAQTDANGSVVYSSVLDMMSGQHGLEARFSGGEDYGSSNARCQFNISYRSTQLRVVKAERTASLVSIRLQLTYPSGFPLGGKVVSFEALNITARSLYAVTDEYGYVVINFTSSFRDYFDSKITVLGDDYISRYQTFVRLTQNEAGFSMASKWGESGAGNLVFGEDEKNPKNGVGLSTQALYSVPDDVVVSATPESGRVDLSEQLVALFETEEDVGVLNFTFYLNGTYEGCDNRNFWTFPHIFEGYTASCWWCPQTHGTYHVEVKVYNSSGIEMEYGETYVSVDRGNSNLIIYYPGAFNSDSVNLLLAFSKARSQNQNSTSEYFQTMNFAPTFTWNNESYALDQPTNSPIIRLCVNGSSVANLTVEDGNGLCGFLLSLDNYTLPCHLDMTATIDDSERFQGIQVEQVFNLTRISVLDDPTVNLDSSRFYMNYTMSVLNSTDIVRVNASATYINAGNLVGTQVVIFNSSAYNVTTAFTTGYLGTRQAANASGFTLVPAGCNYTLLRVVQACYSNSTIVNTAADINKDGVANMRDINLAILLYNKKLGDADYDWTVDVNADGLINMRDYNLVIAEFNRRAYYYNSASFDYRRVSVTCDNGSLALDSRGFAWIPAGATWLNVSCRADVEFFNRTSIGSGVTDNGGRSHITWNAPIQGFCVAETWLASPLNLTVTANCATSPMNASLRTADYYYVFNRTIDVSLSWDDQMQTTVLTACADTYVIENDTSNYGTDFRIYVQKQSPYPEKRAFIRFDLSDAVSANAFIVSARLNVYSNLLGIGNGAFTVYMVNGDWNEQSLNWSNMPGLSATASSVGLISRYQDRWSSFDVTEAVRLWNNGSANYGFAILADPASSLMRNLCSREYNSSQYPPSLQVCYLNGSRDVSVNAYDAAKRGPAQVDVNFSVNGTVMDNGSTNESGVWDYGVWSPSTGGTWNLGAASSATSECKAGSTSSVFILGLPTSMVSLDDGSQRLSKGTIVSNFSLCSSGIFNVSGVTVNFDVNGTYWNGTLYTCTGSSITSDSGAVSFTWNAPDVGSFSVHASFGGDRSYASCEAYALVSVNVLSLSVLFSISPSNFTPGQTVTLNATIMDPLTNSRSNHRAWVKFFNFSSDGSKTLGYSFSDEYGVALCSTFYPSDGKAYAFNATILNCTILGVNLNVSNVVSSPVQLSVGSNTTLSLNVSSTSSPSQYKISGWLKNGTSGLGNRLVSLKINDTVVGSQSTDDFEGWRGCYSFVHDFSAVNNASTTYTVAVSFNGTNAVSVSAMSTVLGGSNYAMCTTVQRSNRPCSNCTTLTVDPQSTLTTTPTKTPEELQCEAEQEGTLQIRDDFSWSFPWYRRHFVSVYEGVEQYDQGISPLPFVDPTLSCSSTFLQTLNALWSVVVWPVAAAVAGAEFFGLIASSGGPEWFAFSLIFSTGLKVLALYAKWNSIGGLAGGLIGIIFSSVIGLLKWSFQLVVDFLKLIIGVINIAQFGFGNLYRIISLPISIHLGAMAMKRLHELGAIPW